MDNLDSFLTYIPHALSIFSLIVALYTIFTSHRLVKHANEQLAEIRNLTDGLVKIEKGLSTRNIGPFPDHIDRITKHIGDAKKEILIAAPVGYGCTSAHSAFTRYESQINIKSSENVFVSILAPDNEKMAEAREIQYKNFDILMEGEKLQSEIAFLQKEENSTIDDHLSFLSAMEKNQKRCIKKMQLQNNDIYLVDSHLPVIFWIFDKQVAIFAIRSFSEYSNFAFETRDPRLIETLVATWKYFKKNRASKIKYS